MLDPKGFRRSPLLENPAARYFVVTSNVGDNVVKSVQHNVWATQRKNEQKFNDAFRSGAPVILAFTVNKSGHFQGYARMRGLTGRAKSPEDPFNGFGRLFDVEWLRLTDLPIAETNHLRNPLDDSRQVGFSRDGQELTRDIGAELCRGFDIKVYLEDRASYEPVVDEAPLPTPGGSSAAPTTTQRGGQAPLLALPPPPSTKPPLPSSVPWIPPQHPGQAAFPYGYPPAPAAPPSHHVYGPPPPGYPLYATAPPPNYGYYGSPPPSYGYGGAPAIISGSGHHRHKGSKRKRRRHRSSSYSSYSESEGQVEQACGRNGGSEPIQDARRSHIRHRRDGKRHRDTNGPDFEHMSYEEYVEWWTKTHSHSVAAVSAGGAVPNRVAAAYPPSATSPSQVAPPATAVPAPSAPVTKPYDRPPPQSSERTHGADIAVSGSTSPSPPHVTAAQASTVDSACAAASPDAAAPLSEPAKSKKRTRWSSRLPTGVAAGEAACAGVEPAASATASATVVDTAASAAASATASSVAGSSGGDTVDLKLSSTNKLCDGDPNTASQPVVSAALAAADDAVTAALASAADAPAPEVLAELEAAEQAAMAALALAAAEAEADDEAEKVGLVTSSTSADQPAAQYDDQEADFDDDVGSESDASTPSATSDILPAQVPHP